MTFTDYCNTQNIQLLKDDKDFIQRSLRKIPKDLHKRVLRRYCEKWGEGIGLTDIVQRKQNLGRRTANLWLLSIVEKC